MGLQVRESWKLLRATRLISAYGATQLIALSCALLRFPIVAHHSSTEILGAWLFWLNLIAWGAVVGGGPINVSRIFSAETGRLANIKSAIKRPKLILAIFLLATILANVISTLPLLMAGLAPTLITLLILLYGAPYLGFQQGIGKVHVQYYASAAGSILSLIVNLLLVRSGMWQHSSPAFQVAVLTAISGATYVFPCLIAWITFKINSQGKLNIEVDYHPKAEQTFRYFLETAAVLPPAFLSGFDSLIIVMTKHSHDLAQYGLTARIASLIAILASALNIQLNNYFLRVSNALYARVKTLGALMIILNLPFIIVFIFLISPTILFLSHGAVHASLAMVLGVTSISIILPLWAVVSAALLSRSETRQMIGMTIIKVVLPSSLISTFVFTVMLGAAGPFFASAFTYGIAVLIGIRLLKNSEKGNKSFQVLESDGK